MAGLTGSTPSSTYGDLLNAGNAGSGVPSSLQQIIDGLGNNTGLFLSTTQIGIGGSDIALKRLAAGVATLTNGSSGTGWLQNPAGEGALAAAFTDATGTLAATNLSFTVIAGRSYRITGAFQVSNTLAADGFQMDFGGGACSATTFWMAASNIGSVVAGTVVATALTTVLNYTTTTSTDYILLNGYLKVNAGGTLIVRAATNTHVSGTMSLGAGSWLEVSDVARL